MLMKFSGQEQLGEPGGVSIIATARALERGGGEPNINHAGLGHLLDEELQLPGYGVKLYDGSQLGNGLSPSNIWRHGYRTLYDRTLHIPVVNMTGPTPMSRLIAVGLAAKEKREQVLPLRFWGTGIGSGSVVSLAVGEAIGSGGLEAAGAIGMFAIANFKGWAVSGDLPIERFRWEVKDLRETHDRDIVFPGQRGVDYLQEAA